MLDERPARAMEDALGNAGRARRIEDVERLVERERRIVRPRTTVRAQEGVPLPAADDRALDRRQLRENLPDLRPLVERLSGVRVRVGRDEDARLDLAEPIQYALHAEIGRARRPRCADRRRAE